MLKVKVIDKLIKLHKNQLNEKIKIKQLHEDVIANIEAQINNLAYEVEKEKVLATTNISVVQDFANYYRKAKSKMTELANNLAIAHGKLAELKDELKDKHIEISKYEYINDTLKKKRKFIENLEEQKQLDEQNILKHNKT